MAKKTSKTAANETTTVEKAVDAATGNAGTAAQASAEIDYSNPKYPNNPIPRPGEKGSLEHLTSLCKEGDIPFLYLGVVRDFPARLLFWRPSVGKIGATRSIQGKDEIGIVAKPAETLPLIINRPYQPKLVMNQQVHDEAMSSILVDSL